MNEATTADEQAKATVHIKANPYISGVVVRWKQRVSFAGTDVAVRL